MAFTAARALQKSHLVGLFPGASPRPESSCSGSIHPTKTGLSYRGGKTFVKGLRCDDGVVVARMKKQGFGQGFGQSFGPKKREVRVGAKWLHGLKGELKQGGSGSSGSSIYDRLGEAGNTEGGPAKTSTTATAVRDYDGRVGNNENGRASLKVDDDFDEDAYVEEEEEEEAEEEMEPGVTADELEERIRASMRESEMEAAKEGEAAKEEQAKEDPTKAVATPRESENIAELRQGLDIVLGAMRDYFSAVYSVGRLIPLSERKQFVEVVASEREMDMDSIMSGDKEAIVAGLAGEERQVAFDVLEEYKGRIRDMIMSEAEKLNKETREYTLVNNRVVLRTPDLPSPSPAALENYIAETLATAGMSMEKMLEFMRPDDVPQMPRFPLEPGAYADVDSEEELRQTIAEQKMLMYAEAANMRQEIWNRKTQYQRMMEAQAAERKAAEQNGQPSKPGLFDPAYDMEKDFEEGERVVRKFELEIEEEFGKLEKSLGLKAGPQGPGQLTQQNYLDIAASIHKLREDFEEGLQGDEALGVTYLKKPVAESDFAEMEQMYREMIENAEQTKSQGGELPSGAFQAMDSLSGAIARMEELIQAGRIEVVRDRDYLDALRAYMAAREGGSDENDDLKPMDFSLPTTPTEVLTEIEDGINSLDYTIQVMKDGSRRPLSASEIIEMQVMDEGLVRWRDEILGMVTNQEQVSALSKLDTLIDQARPFYMVGRAPALKPFTGFRDPNSAAVANVWADLLEDKKPMTTEESVASIWDSLLEEDSSPPGGSFGAAASPLEEESARTGENGGAESRSKEPLGSAKMDNVMTIGNGIQLDLGSAQPDRLSMGSRGATALESDPP